MTSFVPSLIGFNENGEAVYERESRSEAQLQYVKDMQDAIENYFSTYLESVYIENQEISPEIADRIYNWMSKGYSNEHCQSLDNLILVDGLGNRMMNLVR